MRLHLHRSGAAFVTALAAAHGCYYAIFAPNATAPDVLRQADTEAAARGHLDMAAIEALRGPGEALLRAFFAAAGRTDPRWRYAHSSRVLLSIPGYPDLGLLFLLRALRTSEPECTLHVLAADPWMHALVAFEAKGGEPPVFRAGPSRALARAARTLLRSSAVGRTRTRCEILIFTLGENVANGTTDAYFGDFAATLARNHRTHTVYAAPGKRLRLPASAAISPLEAYVSPLDVAGALADSAWKEPRKAAATADEVVIDYLRAREHASGESVMLRIMAKAFERMLARLAPRTVVYPFENRSWEKTLLRAARARERIRCIGYQHSSITPRHLAFSSAAGFSGLNELPDQILTCGEVTADMIRTEIPQARSLVRVGAALRARRLDVPAPVRGVLAPISSSRAEAWEMLRVLHEASALCDQPIIVRTHPTIAVDDLYAQFAWPGHVRLSRGRPLQEDFAESAVVAYSSSTVALEGLLYGRLPIYLEIGDIPSGDPMHGEHAFVFRVSGSRALADALERIDALTSDELAALRREAREYAERYLIEPTPEYVERMAAEVTRC